MTPRAYPQGHRMRHALAVSFVLAFASLPACQKSEAASSTTVAEAEAPVRVQTTQVVTQPMPRYLTVTGSLRADQESQIAADANGKVLQVFIERGQAVHRGDVIATIDARSAALGAAAAQAQSKLAQSQLDQARRECDRVKHLLDTGAISQADYDRQTSQCTQQQWSAAAAEAQQQSATKLLGDTRIRAPFDGIIGEKMVNVGQYVEPSTRVASVYAADPLRLQLTVPEANLASVKQGMPVKFTTAAFGDEVFTATVKYVSPNVRESSRDLVIEAVAPNPSGRLKPGMFAVGRLELGDDPSSVVPTASVSRDETEARVFVVGPNKQIQERLVQLGESKGDLVAILNGVHPGEAVVVKPGPDVRDGARAE
ncbi:MAG TPA: efflux RND transporter periplasmic adaptor subunit [Polyangiaceae bacterium]|nr:efflux RND transporter periplasmic adaptor subunit [Polyangiaceae bacterium]